MLTRTEVADLCQVPTDTLRKWDELGIGPERVRLGRLVRYRESAVAQWWEARRVDSPATPVSRRRQR